MTRRLSAVCRVAAVLAVTSTGIAQATGLHLHLSAVDADGQEIADDRHARTLALYVPVTERVSPKIESRQFHARWTGTLALEQRDRYAFTFRGVGHFALSIDGEQVLDARSADGAPVTGDTVRLSKGPHELVATYTNIPGEDARVVVEWQGRRFAREPLPPSGLTHDVDDPALQRGLELRHGREVFATRRCVHCHGDELQQDEFAMPELAMRGPELGGVGKRLDRGWIAKWLEDPRALRPDARMPRMLHGDAATRAQDASDIAAFLETLTDQPEAARSDSADVEVGGHLFADLGCIACHRIGDEPERDAEASPIDLRGVGSKFRRGALADFLADPRRHDAWIRMPDFGLTPKEAADLAAFLRSRSLAPRYDAPPGDAVRGAKLTAELGCASCHDIPGIDSVESTPLAELFAGAWDRGCVAESADARGKAPDFGLGTRDRAALRVLVEHGIDVLHRTTADEFVARTFEERRCVACHQLDDRTDDWTRRAHLLGELADDGEDHVVAQNRPDLTWAGDKLRPGWMYDFFSGRLEESPRPWLAARMPTFPNIADGVATGLAAMHGHAPRMAAQPAPKPDLVALGQKLVSVDGGFACVTCHAVADKPPLAVFEVQGINLAASGDRLRPDFFHRWMWDPPRLDASSRMPRYADDDGRTAFTDILDGDARQQFGAIWAFLRSLR